MGRWSYIIPECIGFDIASYCRDCRRESRERDRPPEKAMECWKIIVELPLNKDIDYNSVLARSIECSGCWIEYRVGEEKYIAIVTCRGWKAMWSVREKLINELYGGLRVTDKPYLPYRRGGSYYDREYGPWRLWARDYYPDRLPIETIDSLKIICPSDGGVMEYRGKGYKCVLCGFYIPDTIIYEVIENGVADYRPLHGAYSGCVYRLFYKGVDRIVVTIRYHPRRTGYI